MRDAHNLHFYSYYKLVDRLPASRHVSGRTQVVLPSTSFTLIRASNNSCRTEFGFKYLASRVRKVSVPMLQLRSLVSTPNYPKLILSNNK